MIRTIKPLPRDMRDWVNEVCGCASFLNRAGALEFRQGAKWIEKQTVYYTERMLDLLENPPDIPSKRAWEKIRGSIRARDSKRAKPVTNPEDSK